MIQLLISYQLGSVTGNSYMNGHCYVTVSEFTKAGLEAIHPKVKESALSIAGPLREGDRWVSLVYLNVVRLDG